MGTYDQISLKEYADPFTCEPIKRALALAGEINEGGRLSRGSR